MRTLLFPFGVLLLAAAFISIVADMAAQAQNPDLPPLPSLAKTWETLHPQTYDALAPVTDFLMLPGWLILGAPGFALIFFARDRGNDEEHTAHEESLFLFDELTKHAHEEGFKAQADDGPAEPLRHDDFADDVFRNDAIVEDLAKNEDEKRDA